MATDDIPIACTATAEEAAGQVEALDRLAAEHLVRAERSDAGARLWFATAGEPDLRAFVAREQSCCAFFEFAIVSDGDAVRLDIGAPAEAAPILEALFGRVMARD